MATGREWRTWTKRYTGIDGAVSFTIAARLLQVASSIGTVLLILHFLSPVEQGYYYTLLSLAALQTVFELGFSFVILQLAAHEAALLTIHPDGRVEGDGAAHARLASVLKLTLRWYSWAAVALTAVVLSCWPGILFPGRPEQSACSVAGAMDRGRRGALDHVSADSVLFVP